MMKTKGVALLEKGKLSLIEHFWLMTGFIFGSSIILPPGVAAEHDAWIAIIIGLAEGLIFATIFLLLLNRFPGKTIIEICEIVFGRIIGKIVVVLFLWYFFHLGSLVVIDFIDFVKLVIMPETPSLVFGIMIIFICIYAVKHGLEVIGRCSLVLVPLIILLFIGMTLLLYPRFEFKNFLPIFEIPFKKIMWAGHSAATFPFGETIVFTMIIPFVSDEKKVLKTSIFAMVFAGLFLFLSGIRAIGVLGNLAVLYVYPAYQVGRLINIADILSRLEIFIAVNFFTMGFIKIAVLLYGTVLGTAQVFKMKDYQRLVIPIAILMLIAAIINFPNVPANIEFSNNIYPIYAIPFQIGIPALALIVAVIRGLPGRKV